jgi:thiol-disulfide isomerase/thioredoxin
MARVSWAVLAATAVLVAAVHAADEPLTGNWKIMVLAKEQWRTIWLLELESKDGKPQGKILGSAEGFPGGMKFENLRLDGELLHFSLRVEQLAWTFEGKLPKGGDKTINGSFDLGGRQLLAARLEPTTLKNLDSYDVARDALAGKPTDVQLFDNVFVVLRQAEAKKVSAEEVRSLADRTFKAAESYGPRWQREIALKTAEALANQAGFATVAVEYARRAERMTEADAGQADRLRTLNVLARALRSANRGAEAETFQAKADAIEVKAYQDYAKKVMPFKPERYAGRKAPGGRAVLVELFTGAQCPPCIAADLAFDALEKTYQPSEAVLLQYHLHVPQPDPLTNRDSEARQRYYGKAIEGTPTIFFNGKADAAGGGFANEAQDKYKEYREVIDPLLEKPAKVRLQAKAVKKGEKVEITAEVADLEEPDERTRLRLALVEEWVHYAGSNGLRYHHQVVRAMPGDASGFPLQEKASKHEASVDLEELRQKLNRYLDTIEFPAERPAVGLRRLRVVAFVQNDRTKEVLQAVQVPVEGK